MASVYKKYIETTKMCFGTEVTVMSLTDKEEHEITDEERAHTKQRNIDWMWWCYLIGCSIADIARTLEKEPIKITQMLDRIVRGEVQPTLQDPLLTNEPWTQRHDRVLHRMKEASMPPEIAANLLSRTIPSVKQHAKEIKHVQIIQGKFL